MNNKYVIVLYTEEKKYYLSNTFDRAVNNFFGCCYIWGLYKLARKFKTKKEAQLIIKDMHKNNTGKNAKIEKIEGDLNDD